MQKYVIALYIRLSLEDYKCESLSIENQRLILREYAESLPEGDFAEVLEFVDNGYSGANFERPGVQELIEQVRENKIDCIIVKDFSRFGRNSLETGFFIERVFPLFHTRFISVSDSFDSDRFKGDTGGMDVAFKYLISEYYSRDMSMKTKTAKYAKMERGEYQSVICPYGYRKGDDGRMEPDPEVAMVVKQIFQLAAEGKNSSQIGKELYQNQIPTPGEYKAAHGNHTHDISRSKGIWSTTTITRMIADERYIGTYVMCKKAVKEVGAKTSRPKDRSQRITIPHHHTPIVDEELFNKANSSIRRYPIKNREQHDYPLKGKLFCGCCHHALSRSAHKIPLYYCRSSKVDENLPCYGLKVTAPALEEAVFATIRQQLAVALNDMQQNLSSANVTATQKVEYEAQIEAITDEKQMLFESYLSGEIDAETFRIKKASCDDTLQRIKNAYAAVVAQAKQKQEEQARRDNHQKAARAVVSSEGLTADLADLLIDRVLVYQDNRIEIAYKIKDIFD